MLSVVVPVYNSQNTIEEVVERIAATLNDLDDIEYEIILVNDASIDNSLEVCKSICHRHKKVKLITFPKNFGQHNALLAGFKHTTGEYAAAIDDDLEKPPEELKKLVETLEAGDFDVVYGVYGLLKRSYFRKFGTYANDAMATHLIHKPKGVKTSSFFIAKRFILNEILKYDNAFPYIHGLVFRATQNVGNVEICHSIRENRESNYTLGKLLYLWFNGFTNYSVKPLRLSGLLGFIFSLSSFVYILFIILERIFNTQRQLGWTSLMAVIVFFGGVQLISIGLLGEYIGRIFLCMNKTPQYVIKETFNLECENAPEGQADNQGG